LLSLVKRILAPALIGLVAVAGYAVWYVLTPLAATRYPAEFEVVSGSGLRSAARQIEAAGIALGRIRFEILVRVLGRSQEIKAGSYELASAVTPLELLDKLTRGDVTQAELVLIEGWAFRQVRAVLEANVYLRVETRGLSDTEILRRLGVPEGHPEGLFYPDTYLFSKGTSDLTLLLRAYHLMQKRLARAWETRASGLPYNSPYEALIMASIIEKETGRAAERGMIAGVLLNRLRIGMRLQVDPSVIYGLGARFDGNLRKRDLLEDGPYNTYSRAGLPPTPIAIPGLGSLHAALQPAKTDAMYYVARGDGSSAFSRTLNDHNRAVTKYQRRNN